MTRQNVMLNSQIEGYMRAKVSDMLNDTCTIYQEGTERGETGAPQPTLSTIASSVACRVIKVGTTRGMAAVMGSREAIQEEYRIIVAYDQALAVNYSITTDSDSATYRVQAIENNLTNRVYRSVIVIRTR